MGVSPIDEARAILEAKWSAEGDCKSCGWHACLYEHWVTDAQIENALINNNGILELGCRSKDDDDRSVHRGIRIDIAGKEREEA